MSAISLRLPESLHRKLKKLAADEDVSINQFIATAVAEKMSALMTESYLQDRAARGSRSKFNRVLKKVKSSAPRAGDE
jgi:predicted transcriptional regulator